MCSGTCEVCTSTAQSRYRKERTGHERILKDRSGTDYRLRYLRDKGLEVGWEYTGRKVLTYVLDKQHEDLAEHAYEMASSLPYRDNAMRDALRHVLPAKVRQLYLKDGHALVFEKPAGLVPLHDVQVLSGNSIGPRHVAWMTSAMLNLTCYLQTMGLAYQGMTPRNLLVDPGNHSVALYAGWWWAGRQGEPLRALPADTVRSLPPHVLADKRCTVRVDQLMLRHSAREMLGASWSETPRPMRRFLELPPPESAIDDYTRWMDVLEESFGRRRFVQMEITAEDVYAMTG